MTDTSQNPTAETHEPKAGGLSLSSIVLLIGVTAFVAVIGVQLARRNTPFLEAGQGAPNFTVTSFDGETYTLNELRGKVVVVNFWASWCGPCEDEAPMLEALWQEYKDKDFLLLGITHSDVERDSLRFIADYQITYPNAPDPGGRIYDLYNLTGVPESFVIAPDGSLAYVLHGPISPTTTPQFFETIAQLMERAA